MLYRITLDLSFPTIAHAQAVEAVALAQWQWAVPIHPGQPDEEPCFVLVQECHHDENPPQPCSTISYIRKPPRP